jgi:hypothetical protein
MKEDLKVLFYLKKNQMKADGLCPVMGRITVGRTMAQFATKLETDASKWNTKVGRMNGQIPATPVFGSLTHISHKSSNGLFTFANCLFVILA